MNELPIGILQNISTFLNEKDLKNVSQCNKELRSSVHSLFQNKTKEDLCSMNINELYKHCNTQLLNFYKTKQSKDVALNYDIDWCLSRFHSERQKKITGLTQEQKDIINYEFKPGSIILVQAFAGTGKTTTLINLAKHNDTKKVLYLTFNKSLVDSAKRSKVLDNMTICTMHSLALQKIDPEKKMNIGKLSLPNIESILNVDRQEASIVLKILNNFFASNSKVISECHMTNLNLMNEKLFLDHAGVLWTHILYNKCKEQSCIVFMLSTP